jgi:GNAT superfamily N-acetyltransferase
VPNVVIRLMQPEDLQPAIVLLDGLRLRTPYRACRPDWGVVVQTLMVCMNPMQGLVLVAEHDGKLTGILIATLATLWWADQRDGPRMASDLVFHSTRYGDGRRMLAQLIEWAFNVPRVIRIEMAVSSGQGTLASARRLYESAGFALEGTLFTMNHPKYNEILDGRCAA